MMKISNMVKILLEDDERCRNSDSYLYLQIVKDTAAMNGIDLRNVTVPDFLLSMGKEFPPFETVRRTRQKVQATYPELCASERVEAFRAENEKIFREYARREL